MNFEHLNPIRPVKIFFEIKKKNMIKIQLFDEAYKRFPRETCFCTKVAPVPTTTVPSNQTQLEKHTLEFIEYR